MTVSLVRCSLLFSATAYLWSAPLGAESVRSVQEEATRGSPPIVRVLERQDTNSSDGQWWNRFSLPVLDSRVRAFTVFRGELIAAGGFEMAGGQRVNHIARWDGRQWQPLGEGIDGEIYALSVYRDRLIVGCQYVSPFGPLASWDGLSWSPLSPPVSGFVAGIEVRALLVQDDRLIAAGSFDRMGILGSDRRTVEVPLSNIGSWNGSTWEAMAEGLDGAVDALGLFHGQIVAGGEFSNSGSNPLSKVAQWDGDAWQPLGSGILAGYSQLHALATFQDTLYAGGLFDDRPLLRFGGTAWDTVPGSQQGQCRALMVDGQHLFAAGSFFQIGEVSHQVRAWDGSNWSDLGADPWPIAEAIIKHEGRLVVGGLLESYGSYFEDEAPSHVMVWSGTSWDPLEHVSTRDQGLRGYIGALLEFDGALVAAGSLRYMTPMGWSPPGVLARWDGSAWSALGQPLSGGATSLAAHGGGLVVAGNFHSPDSPEIHDLAKWNGQQWERIGEFPPGSLVTSVAVLRDTLYAAFGSSVARWDDPIWTDIGQFLWQQGGAYDLRFGLHRGHLYVGGSFDHVGEVAASNVALWDGAWYPLGAGTNSRVNAFASLDSELVVGGSFWEAGGSTAYGLALWDGMSWLPFPGVVAQNVSALLVRGDELFAAAGLLLSQILPGVPAGYNLFGVARWDGTDWRSLGSGVNGRVMALSHGKGSLFVGGDFTEAGGRASFRIGQWLFPQAMSSGPATWEAAFPNPFSSGGVRLDFSLTQAAAVRLAIHDISGREVALLVSGSLEAGVHRIAWTGQDEHGSPLPAGIYFASLSTAGKETTTKRLTLLR